MSLLLAMCSFTTLLADSGYVFRGKIGNYPIVLTIWATAVEASGEYYYVSQGKNKKLQLTGAFISELDSPQLVWRFVETVNGKYNGVYYVVWNYFIGKSSDIVGAYINSKGDEYEVNLKCTSHESLRESDGY